MVRVLFLYEKKDFQYRLKKFNKSNLAIFGDHLLVEPNSETGVYGIAIKLMTIDPNVFPFEILDYNTHTGIDIIVKQDKITPIHQSKLFYVEFKYFLQGQLNHSFENIHSIICWDTNIKHGDYVVDINREERSMVIADPHETGGYTKYFLDSPKRAHKIEVYVLKDYLRETYNLEFRPRSGEEIV